MSSYLPPTSDLPSFNSQIFQSNLSTEEVESKIKALETNVNDLETKNDYVSVDTTDGDKYNIALGNNGTFKVLAKENGSQGFFVTDMKSGTDCPMYIGDGCDELIATRDADDFPEKHTLLTLRHNGISSGQGRPLLVMKFNVDSDTNDYDWNRRCAFSQNGDDIVVKYTRGANDTLGEYGSGQSANMKFISTGGITIGNTKFPMVATTQQHTTSGINEDGTQTGTQTFGITYTTPPIVNCQMISSSGNNAFIINVYNVTTTEFQYRKFYAQVSSDGVFDATDEDFYWIAIGDASL
jgi:hypothetical protein